MKQLILLILILSATLNLAAQSTCKYQTSVPDELYRKRYKEADMWYGNPYTMFNRRTPGWNFIEAVKQIKLKVATDGTGTGSFNDAYHKIYSEAIKAAPAHCNFDQKECKHPQWVKANAIVYLVGLKDSATNSQRFIPMTPTELEEVRIKVETGLQDLNPTLPSCFGGEACDPVMERALDLIRYLQAYDVMKAAGQFGAAGDGDRNGSECSPRNKLREFARNLYIEAEDIINSRTGWKKNQGIICGSALVMAGIVLNDAGVETNYLTGIFGFLWGDGFNWPRPNYSPGNWVDRGHGNGGYDIFGGEDGLEENLFTGYHPYTIDVPQTNSDGTAGYAEGPGYFNYLAPALLGAMRAMDNFVPHWNNKNYLHKEKYLNILRWMHNIQTASGTAPSYDNSGGIGTNLKILGVEDFFSQGGLNPFDLYGDYLLANAPAFNYPEIQSPKVPLANAYSSMASGNSILRTKDSLGDDYFMFLHEKENAIDRQASVAEISHEDDDMGSFLIYKRGSPVAYDPYYSVYARILETNKYDDHNIIQLINNGDNGHMLYGDPTVVVDSGTILLKYKCFSYASDIERQVSHYSTVGTNYWMLNDKVSETDSDIDKIRWQMNGIGKASNSTYSYSNRISNWKTSGYPFFISSSTFLNADNEAVTAFSKYEESPPNATISSLGFHTRIELFQNRRNTLIQTLIYPYQDTSKIPEIIRREDNEDYVTTRLRFKNLVDTTFRFGKNQSTDTGRFLTDTIYDLHIARMGSGTTVLSDPFHTMETMDTLKTDGLKGFASINTYTKKTSGFCVSPTFIKMKACAVYEGTFINFNDTNYIEADATMNKIEYAYAGKYRYEGYCSGTGNVIFYMPDMMYGFPMKATGPGVSSYSHNDTGNYKFISVYFGQPGRFVLELKDPCLDDCFFPPTNVTIDTLFKFDLGITKSLSHDLDIVAGDGLLKITNASRMSICPDNVLVNKDSIVMQMSCAPERRWSVNEDGSKVQLPPDTLKYLCDRNELIKDRAINDTRNMIIVNDRAGLVLDSGSLTHIGNNSTILVRPGGSLLIKAGATVIIGDKDCVQNRGELLADHGSYVCVEEGAILKFYNDIDSLNFYYKDTIDRHIVFIAMPKGVGKPGAIPSLNVAGGRGKFNPAQHGIWAQSSCLEFCDWKGKNPPYGVNNRPFGWCNISAPRAYFKSLDTLCIGDPFSIDATPSLNETGYTITICRYDTGSQTCLNTIDSISDNGDNCLSRKYLFTPDQAGYYRVRLIVHNDCSLKDTFTKMLYVPYLPVASFSLPSDSICPGEGTLIANGTASMSNIANCRHRWSIEPIIEDSTDSLALLSASGNQDWLIDSVSVVESAFDFPGYRFTGGMRYLVSLTVWGWCSDSIVWDTVSVPLKVAIDMEAASTVYSNPTGPAAILLKGIVLNATSWSWDPETYLDFPDSLNTIATPPDSIQYILTGSHGSCSISDTVTICHNTRTYAGTDRSVCFDQSAVLGTDLHAAAMLGVMYRLRSSAFYSVYEGCREDGSTLPINIQKYLTEYLIERGLTNSYPEAIIELWTDHPEIRNAIITNSSYATYLTEFTSNNGSSDALYAFKNVLNSNIALKTAVDALDFKEDYLSSLGVFFSDFETWYTAKAYNSTYIDIIWEKKVDTTWYELSDWRTDFNPVVDTTKSTTYRMTLIDNVNSLVEYDEVIISIDTAFTPRFEIAFQEDSTLYFSNVSSPSPFHKYDWNFGDGSLSAQYQVIHTFPAFDSMYVVCLSVTNGCGTYTYCDSIRVDSLGLVGSNLLGNSKSRSSDKVNENVSLVSTFAHESISSQITLSKDMVKLENVPNPFTASTTLSYSIGIAFKQAELRIMDVLGRTIRTYPIHSLTGDVLFDGIRYEAGIYYAVIVVDNLVQQSKAMVIEK